MRGKISRSVSLFAFAISLAFVPGKLAADDEDTQKVLNIIGGVLDAVKDKSDKSDGSTGTGTATAGTTADEPQTQDLDQGASTEVAVTKTEIAAMVRKAYKEGFADGYASGLEKGKGGPGTGDADVYFTDTDANSSATPATTEKKKRRVVPKKMDKKVQ